MPLPSKNRVLALSWMGGLFEAHFQHVFIDGRDIAFVLATPYIIARDLTGGLTRLPMRCRQPSKIRRTCPCSRFVEAGMTL